MTDSKDRRKILLVEACEDGTTGGSHRALFDLVLLMDRTRFAPEVLYYQQNPYVSKLRQEGIPVHVWSAERGKERRAKSAAGRVWALLKGIAMRASFLRQHDIDVVHLNNTPTQDIESWGPACYLTRRRLIGHLRGQLQPSEERLNRLRLWLGSRCYSVISMSRHSADVACGLGLVPRRLEVVLEGVNLSEWIPSDPEEVSAIRSSLDLAQDDRVILIPGNLKPWKGQADAFSALMLLSAEARSRLVILIAGTASPDDQAYAECLRKQADTLSSDFGVSVRFLGHRSDMRRIYQAADIVLHCSVEPEPWGLVVLEAMAMGRPVVASAIGGPAEMQREHSSGMVLADPRDHAALAKALDVLLTEPDRLQTMANNARAHSESISLQRAVELITAHYVSPKA